MIIMHRCVAHYKNYCIIIVQSVRLRGSRFHNLMAEGGKKENLKLSTLVLN